MTTIIKNPDIRPQNFHGMYTVCPKMFELFTLIERVAKTESSILVRGETGTGKELVAKAIHSLSPRSQGPFHAINCATLTPELIISELFGHEKGAFTGAVNSKRGFFEISNNGTIFLDEIAEIPLEIQARLLRVLQERTVTPLGSTKTLKVNVRVISATHKALRIECREKRFREDLMYRLRVIPLFLPRLAERGDDIKILTWMFIKEFNTMSIRKVSGIEAEAMEALFEYPWPGNIRELRNNIEYAFAVGEGSTIKLTELPPELRGEEPIASTVGREDEKKTLQLTLNQTGGRKAEAAKMLNMSRSTFWRKMREHHLSK